MPTLPDHPSLAAVADIASTSDPVQRNCRITLGYWRLALAVRALLPGGVNWCGFGTWASKQAGQSIRQEDVEKLVARTLRARLEQRPLLAEVHQALRIPEQKVLRLAGVLSRDLPGVARTAAALALGNQQIFAEIGAAFAGFLATLAADPGDASAGTSAHTTPDALAAFLASFRPGPPPDGQDLLRSAFTHLAAAITDDAAGPAVRAQRLLLANLQIALHEQTRAQPLVREAMDAAMLDVHDTRRRVRLRLEELLDSSPVGSVRTGVGFQLLNSLTDEISGELRAVVRAVITERLMSIELPGGRVLRLGRDVPGIMPASLTNPSDPDLVAQLAALDRDPASTRGSRSRDWSVLADRMNFLADFFRCYQEDDTLFEAPFDEATTAAIDRGQPAPAGEPPGDPA